MTLQELQDTVHRFKEQTEIFINNHPGLKEIRWVIEDVPYKIFEEFRKSLPEDTKVNHSQGQLYIFAPMSYGKGPQIIIWSVPVKIKETIEVIEEELQPETI